MPRHVLVRSLSLFASASLLAFICWLIYLADTGNGPSNVLFRLSYQIPYGDKAGHFLLFGPLAFAVNAALQFRKVHLRRSLNSMYLGTLLVIAFVLIEEFSQYFFPNRTVELLDLLADGAGIALFTWLSSLLDRAKYGGEIPPPFPISLFRLDSGFLGLYSPICLSTMKQLTLRAGKPGVHNHV